ncbi:MAG: hypothetical protein LR015_08095 [Verrucomicrobia bacterium]|nr:hypothetical protein [Verrucomicrobiota bacterium]
MVEILLVREGGMIPQVRLEALRNSVVWLNDLGRREEAISRAVQLRDDPVAAERGLDDWARAFVDSLVNPNFREVPWPDHEYSLYRLDSVSGEPFGYGTFWKEKTEVDGRMVWDQRSFLFVVIANQVMAGRLLFATREEQYRPYSFNGRTAFSDNYSIRYDWSGRQVSFRNEDGRASTNQMPGTEILFDVEKFFTMPRLLDSSFGEHYRFSVAVPGGFFWRGAL